MKTRHLFDLVSSFSDGALWLKPLIPQLLDGRFRRISESGGKYESSGLRSELTVRLENARNAEVLTLGIEDLLSQLSSMPPKAEVRNFGFSKDDSLFVIYLDASDKIVGVIFVTKAISPFAWICDEDMQ